VCEVVQAGDAEHGVVHSELLATWQDRKIIPPAFYLCGAGDITRTLTDTSRIGEVTTDLRGVVDVPGAGHWVQMDRPDEVNATLLDFFKRL
jgi:pimeloyl-ACP methyl ester carboxylesterase